MRSKHEIKSAFESMMFIWGEPLEAKLAADVMNVSLKDALSCFRELMDEYEQEGRGLRIREVDGSFQFVTAIENAEHVERLCTPIKSKRLTQAALEVLAIVAYKQPVTKGTIESIRGIKCDRVIEGLMNKDLVKELGRSEGIGRPILYGTTNTFLANFGFKNLSELPEIEDIESVLSDNDVEEEPAIDLNQMTLDI